MMSGLNLRGDITDNILVGSVENDTLVGRRGLDTILGLSGDDLIWGNDDDDRLFGNAGKDSIYGGKNNDTLEGGKDDDELSGNQGDDVILGNDGNDVVLGGGGNDLVFGGVGDDSLFGNSGNDVLFGGRGNDAIFGGKGNDHLEGDKGDDTIYGDVGADTITGGDGRDVIVLEESSRVALDTITDFQPAEDAVRLPDGTTFEELVFEPNGAGGTVVRDGRSGKALLVLPGVDSATLTPQNFQSSNPEPTPDPIVPPATETPEENEDANDNAPDTPVTEADPDPAPETPTDNPGLEPETPAENPEPETPPTNNTPDPVPDTPPPADPPPDPVPENQPPIAIDDIATTEFNTAIEISVLDNDTDPDGDVLTVTVDEESASNGTVTTDGTTVTYTPNADFTGIDRVTYTVSDGTDSNTGSIEIEVEPEPVLTANDDYFEAELYRQLDRIDDYILGNDINPSDRPLTLTFDENPTTRGTIVTDEWGEVTYIPEPGFRGTDTVTYTISDGIDTDTAVLEIYFPDIEAQDDVILIPHGTTSVEIDLFGNDIYPDDTQVSWYIFDLPRYGTVTSDDPYTSEFTSANRPIFTYTFDPDFVETDTFRYEINGRKWDEATVTIVTTEAIWIGGDGAEPTNWSNPNNWAHGQVPYLESVIIPASTVYQPVLTENTNVLNLTVEDGASLDIGNFRLDVDGHLSALGNITGEGNGRVRLSDSIDGSTLQGDLPNLFLNTYAPDFSRVVGATIIDGNLEARSLDINGHEVTVTGNVDTRYDGLIMDDPNDILNVGGSFSMLIGNPGESRLIAGTINILGETSDYNVIDSIQASGTHTVVLQGSKSLHIDWQQPQYVSDEQYFQNLIIDIVSEEFFNNFVELRNVKINGSLTLDNGWVTGDRVFINGNLFDNTELGNREFEDRYDPWNFDSSWQVNETIIMAKNPSIQARLETHVMFVSETTLASDLLLKGDLTVKDNFQYYRYSSDYRDYAILNLGGNEVSVSGDVRILDYESSLVMAHPNDVLTVGGEFYVEHPTHSQFTAGTLKLQEDEPFTAHYSYYEPNGYIFRASGTHTVSFNGSTRQVIPDFEEFFNRDLESSYFQNVEIDNPSEVVFYGNTTINGNVILTRGKATSAQSYYSPEITVTIGGDMIADSDNSPYTSEWEVENTKFIGENPQLPEYLKTNATFTNQVTFDFDDDFTLDGKMIIEETGELSVSTNISVSDGITFLMSDGFKGVHPDDNWGTIELDNSGVLYVGDIETTATIPYFRSNPVFRWSQWNKHIPLESLYIKAHEGSEPHHGGILDVRYGVNYIDTDLEIVTRDGVITLGNFNAPDALATPGIVRLSSDGGDSDASLLSRNDAGELTGTVGSDRIIGKAEAQTIDGGYGQDIISGGEGADVLTGGYSTDIFVYDNPSEGGDTITDFSSSQEDKIQFSSENFSNPTIEFDVAAASTDQATVYATPLSGGTQQVMFDADGNGVAQPVHLATLTNLSVALEDGDISGYGAYPFDSSSSMR
ncbi:MAG: Ig-like domain-containing protein [Cyanobacteriota bacterium]|nr:Ig-like domain-containing protein [Cyanobacteriota bacterium]